MKQDVSKCQRLQNTQPLSGDSNVVEDTSGAFAYTELTALGRTGVLNRTAAATWRLVAAAISPRSRGQSLGVNRVL